MQEVQLRKEIFDYLPWSYSKLEMARRCPFSFNRKNVDGIKETYVESQEAKIGKFVHLVIEDCLKGRDITTAYKKIYTTKYPNLTNVELDLCMSYRPGILTFINKIKNFPGIKKQYIELSLAITQDFKPGQYWGKDPLPLFRGVLDYALLADNGSLAIIDHKSGGTPTRQYAEKQMLTYEILSYFGMSEEIKSIKTILHYVSSQEMLDFAGVTAKEIMEVRKNDFINFMNSCVEELHTNEAKVGKHCDWCSYVPLCPKKNKKKKIKE